MQLTHFLIGWSLIAALAGCAAGPSQTVSPEATEQSLALVDSQGAFGYESPDWGTPFWERLSEKFDRARSSREPAPTAAAPMMAEQPDTQPMTPYAGTPAIAQNNAPQAVERAAPPNGALHSSIALAWSGSGPAPATLQALGNRLASSGFIVIQPAALQDAIGDAPGCDRLMRPTCLASIARYPAPRLLIVAEPSDADRIQLSSFDAQFGARYPVRQLSAARPEVSALNELVDASRRRLAIAPWFTRSFAERDGLYYLSAGADSGLEVGDRLAVHADGRLVRGPAGQPVVWQPGAVSGALEIEQLLGMDTSVARPLDAVKVTPDALLVADTPDVRRP